MLKAPIEGTVKTRLGREIGMASAASAYRRLVEHQLRQIPSTWKAIICYAPRDALTPMQQWLDGGHSFQPQADGDLGVRLAMAAQAHFAANPTGPLVILGGDCPYLGTERLEEAAAQLAHAEVVVVPATDGGYCLIALRAPMPEVFEDIAWSTAKVMEQTRERLRALGAGWCEMATLEDVDDREGWERACEAFPQLGFTR